MKKVILLIIILSIALGTLFYFSRISFQIDAFKLKLWASEVLFFLVVVVAISGFISLRHGKRWSRKKDESQ
ncbi:hypothetical protein [Nonlabens ulvanivorans]|uniref:hypothetical protein n=1 Tax=Nonlabens ulvanivorans TaxID=906888 RepID=UPI002942325D|nr:hypothetical protein [Nonlabens ulvanivorans]WOI23703.1 hypothetical protein R1T42_04430 [Nonlabens ulvanivorans]